MIKGDKIMLEKKLNRLLEEAKEIRQQTIENKSASYYNDVFYNLSNFISKKLRSSFFKNKNARIIADHFDEILSYIVMSNINIILLNINLLIEQPNFKEKFTEGLKKYPYKDGIEQLFYCIWTCLNNGSNRFDDFIDNNILKTLSIIDARKSFYLDILNKLNEENQKNFLNFLVENKCDIPYTAIEYKGNNKNIIFDNLPLFIEHAQNLYTLINFVKNNPVALSQVKDYIDNNEEKAINSIFCETDHLTKMKDSTIKEIVKLIILDVKKNENVKFSDITYNGGGFSRVLLIGSKVIKIGDRITKKFPNNPYIVTPLLRKELQFGDEHCFIEVTERVDTTKTVTEEDLYQLFKHLRDLKLDWTDIKSANVGRLTKENIIHWRESLKPTEEVLGLDNKRGEIILKEGDLVILDADFIYDEADPNINYTNNKELHDKFEKRYQSEKKKLKKQEQETNLIFENFNETTECEMSEQKGFHM